jgi:dynein heavy chain
MHDLQCRSEAGPLLEVELELVTPDMVWKPELGGSEKGSVQALVQRWLTSFLEVRKPI